MTHETFYEQRSTLAKHVREKVSAKAKKTEKISTGKMKDTNDTYYGKRFRRKPMKCVSMNYEKRKQLEECFIDNEVDVNNNNTSPALHTEVIDIEEERVKDKTNIFNNKTRKKRNKTSLDQLLSRVVAKKNKLEENHVKNEAKKHERHENEEIELEKSINFNKLPYTRSDRHVQSAFTPVITNRHHSSSSRHHQEYNPPRYPSSRRHFPTTVISPPPSKSSTPAIQTSSIPTPAITSSIKSPVIIQRSNQQQNSSPDIESDYEEQHQYYEYKKPNKRTTTTNQRYAKLSNSQLQRRLVANARERSRVHALSNAFDALRCTIPSYSTEQKLSKLTILRVAINYIDALTQLLAPTTPDTQKRFEKCVDECTAVLQTEYGRSKMK